MSDSIHMQCCVCHLPATPEGHPRDKVSHGYHWSCFQQYYGTHDPEMLEDYTGTEEGWLPALETGWGEEIDRLMDESIIP